MNQTELKQRLHYDPETGVFTWLQSRGRVSAGTVAGSDARGYVEIAKNLAHRLAWLYMTGSMPQGEIDHINGIKDDNRWCNLRDVDKPTQQRNLSRAANNTSGVTGVYWQKSKKKWVAGIKVNRRKHRLYYGDNPFMAVYCRAKAEHDHNFHPNHGR